MVRPEDSVLDGLRVLVTAGLPGLVVSVGDGFVIVAASQTLRVALPRYVLDQPSLARVWDEHSADAITRRLGHLRVADLVAAVNRHDGEPAPMVDGDATVVEVAAALSSAHVPLVAVVDEGRFVGVVTVNRLVWHLLG